MVMLPARFLGLLNRQELIINQTRNSDKAFLSSLLQQGGARTSNIFPCSFAVGVRLVLYMLLYQRCVQGSGLRGDLGDLPTPLVVVSAGSCSQCPNRAPGSSEVAVGFHGFFVSFVQNLPQLLVHSYFQSLIVFLYFVV